MFNSNESVANGNDIIMTSMKAYEGRLENVVLFHSKLRSILEKLLYMSDVPR